jgi:serine/threonine-protein phosphatase 2B regulatory subunit
MGNEKSKAGVKSPPSPAPSGVIPVPTSTSKASAAKAPDEAMIKDVTSKSHFDQFEVTRLYSIFDGLASKQNRTTFDRTLLKEALGRLNEVGLKNLNNSPFADRLFSMLDSNNDGVVDFAEFVVGLSHISKGTAEERLIMLFKAFDADKSGFIQKDEMAAVLKMLYLNGLKALNASTVHEEFVAEDLERFAEGAARSWIVPIFENLDSDGDQKLSYADFKKFTQSQPKITVQLNGFKKELPVGLI